jgi:hypothetical protein
MEYRKINVIYEIPLISDERIDSDDLNPLKRALHKALTKGNPLKNFTMCFINDQISEGEKILRWFGVFVHSDGDRLIFFPGFSERQGYVQGFQGKSKVWDKKFLFDHFSVEKNLKKWHLTTIDPVDHLGSGNILKLNEDKYLMFGLSVNSLGQFRVVKQITKFSYSVPKSDADRRKDIVLSAKGDMDYQILEFFQPKGYFNPEIFHFGIIIGKKGFEPFHGPDLGFPEGSPFLEGMYSGRVQLPTRIHKFNLSDDFDIQITTLPLPAVIKKKLVLITSQGKKLEKRI